MTFRIRALATAVALTAITSLAQAQTATQEHDTHHPGATAPQEDSAAPAPAPSSGQTGMMGGDRMMMPMMGGMMGSQGQPGMGGGMSGMMPMMHQMMMGPQGGAGPMGLPFEHVEGRLAFLEAELAITEAQKPRWAAFADAFRASARAHRAAHERRAKAAAPATWPDRLAAQAALLSSRLEATKGLEAAAWPLYEALTPEQRTLADRLIAGPMGMM